MKIKKFARKEAVLGKATKLEVESLKRLKYQTVAFRQALGDVAREEKGIFDAILKRCGLEQEKRLSINHDTGEIVQLGK